VKFKYDIINHSFTVIDFWLLVHILSLKKNVMIACTSSIIYWNILCNNFWKWICQVGKTAAGLSWPYIILLCCISFSREKQNSLSQSNWNFWKIDLYRETRHGNRDERI
jgi:hypothetical protein